MIHQNVVEYPIHTDGSTLSLLSVTLIVLSLWVLSAWSVIKENN